MHTSPVKPVDPANITSKQLRIAVKTLGWNNAELARRAFVTPGTVSRWMNGGDIPGLVGAYVALALEICEMAARLKKGRPQ